MANNFPESTDMRVFKAMTYSPMAFFPTNFMIQTGHDDEHHHPSSFTPSFHTYQDFQGVSPINDLGKRSISSYCSGFEGRGEGEANMEDELSDDGMQLLGEKKKRLNMVQVKTLEKSFELGNKLEPDRKMQLARALGLQPRQIGIWFQNRRARWKTKQLEKDYQTLKRQFDAIKQENDALQDNNKILHDEINALKKRQENIETINLKKETDEGSCSNRSSTEQSCDMNLNISRTIAVSHVASMDTAAADHHHDPSTMAAAIINNKPFFNNNYYYYYSSIINNNNNNNNSAPEFLNNFNQKMHMDNVAAVKEESLCSMFGFDQQDHQVNSSSAGFWPWMEHQHYH